VTRRRLPAGDHGPHRVDRLTVGREATARGLVEHDPIVDADRELAAPAVVETGLGAEGLLDLGSRTGRLGAIASHRAEVDLDLHDSRLPPPARAVDRSSE